MSREQYGTSNSDQQRWSKSDDSVLAVSWLRFGNDANLFLAAARLLLTDVRSDAAIYERMAQHYGATTQPSGHTRAVSNVLASFEVEPTKIFIKNLRMITEGEAAAGSPTTERVFDRVGVRTNSSDIDARS